MEHWFTARHWRGWIGHAVVGLLWTLAATGLERATGWEITHEAGTMVRGYYLIDTLSDGFRRCWNCESDPWYDHVLDTAAPWATSLAVEWLFQQEDQPTDSMIAAGIYPSAVTDVQVKNADDFYDLFKRLEHRKHEWIGCLYGAIDSKTRVAVITDYRDAIQLHSTPTSANALKCPGRAIGRLHNHVPSQAPQGGCGWPAGDIATFKSAVSYQGYSYYIDAILCIDDGLPAASFYGWDQLRQFEERHGVVPFFFTDELWNLNPEGRQ